MFTPNLQGTIQGITGRDVHGRHKLGPEKPCPFGSVSLKVGARKTSVRADSSASRGSASETAVERGRILIPAFIEVSNGSIFSYQSAKYEVVSVHPRYAISGALDHWEVDLETFLG
ncbi:hypothetical protein PXK56_18035 [Phaeobacter gallaeciensis]|uniref:hypothetical protein n=1 Tax=Phaeobacter gallaeciensis TaxID=60890 RepID=UPI002380908C|nr:hypothetical protein [Phaeobacter gallaeciensis]MDE4297090.1 hypothetical protein [Phaeobacter gallaeciensis]